ncbi:tRNA modification GTPase, partial [Moellerella wisconsensis]
MNDEIKKIAALIGHQQAQEKRVAALIDEFQAESAKLTCQTAQLVQVINELDSASGKMTDTVRQAVNAALTQVEKELKQ